MILIFKDGCLFCNDNRYRSHVLYGNVRGCVKEYKRLGQARRVANNKNAKVVVIPIGKGMSINSAMLVIEQRDCQDKIGYCTYHHHDIKEFIVE